MIEAKQTDYKGVTYRSKLEARWCVFFDYLGVTYEYEPESFDLGLLNPNWDWEDSQELREELEESGDYTDSEIRREVWLEKNKKLFYIPDFWLPQFRHWVEIKGKYPTVNEQRKARLLAYRTGEPVNILYGSIPEPKEDWGKHTEVYQSDMNIIALLVIKYGLERMEQALIAARHAQFHHVQSPHGYCAHCGRSIKETGEIGVCESCWKDLRSKGEV